MFSTVFIVFPIGNHEARLGEVAKPPPKDPRRELAAAIKKTTKGRWLLLSPNEILLSLPQRPKKKFSQKVPNPKSLRIGHHLSCDIGDELMIN
jgi:hypothetical protein